MSHAIWVGSDNCRLTRATAQTRRYQNAWYRYGSLHVFCNGKRLYSDSKRKDSFYSLRSSSPSSLHSIFLLLQIFHPVFFPNMIHQVCNFPTDSIILPKLATQHTSEPPALPMTLNYEPIPDQERFDAIRAPRVIQRDFPRLARSSAQVGSAIGTASAPALTINTC
jgi:hypothetical protein